MTTTAALELKFGAVIKSPSQCRFANFHFVVSFKKKLKYEVNAYNANISALNVLALRHKEVFDLTFVDYKTVKFEIIIV